MFELKSLGVWSAFNAQEYGNNSWYCIEKDKVLMIDCGSTVFKTFRDKGLDNYKEVNIIITHMHTDHVGSLGTLIEWMYYVKGTEVNIIINEELEDDILSYLEIVGIEYNMFNLSVTSDNNNYIIKNKLVYIIQKTNHVPQIISYSITLIRNKTGMIVYSGDTTERFEGLNDSLFQHYSRFRKEFPQLELHGLYLDISINNSPVHSS